MNPVKCPACRSTWFRVEKRVQIRSPGFYPEGTMPEYGKAKYQYVCVKCGLNISEKLEKKEE